MTRARRTAHQHQHQQATGIRALSTSTGEDDESASTTTTNGVVGALGSRPTLGAGDGVFSSSTTTPTAGWTKYQTHLLAAHPANGPHLKTRFVHRNSVSFFSTNNSKKKSNDDDAKDEGRPSLGTRFGKLGAIFDEVGKELKSNKDIQESLKELNKLKEEATKPMSDSISDLKVSFFLKLILDDYLLLF